MVTVTGSGVVPHRVLVTRNLLYEAAAALFVERGYDNTTMADIAERAGTSRRTAYNHFPSKGDIPKLWTRLRADRVLETIAESGTDDAVERIRAYFRLLRERMTQDAELSRQMIVGWTAAIGPIRYESQLLPDLVTQLQTGQDEGSVDPAIDVELVARTLNDAHQGAVVRWVREQAVSDTPREVSGAGIDLVLSAIRARR